MITYDKQIVPLNGLKNGYLIFRDSTHPLAYISDGAVYLHRHVASIKYGRWLTKNDVVHHVDHNKLNNNPDNLLVLSNSEHSLLHNPELNSSINCIVCSRKFLPHNNKQIYCSQICYKKTLIKNTAVTAELLQEYRSQKLTWVAIAKLTGYSDVGIRKRAKSLGID